jgi:membrane protein required for colicin V production
MTWLDYAVIGVIAISALWGVWHGLVREVLSLAGWVIAFLAANLLAAPIGERLPEAVARPELRVLLAFVLVFVLSLVVTTLVAQLLTRALKAAGLGGLDRVLGAVFGVARGLVILLAFALLAGLTRFPADPAWRGSFFAPVLGRAAIQIKPWLPPAFAERLRYH